MTIRDWVQDKFANGGLEVSPVGEDGLAVTTPLHPNAVVVVPTPGPETFGAPQLGRSIEKAISRPLRSSPMVATSFPRQNCAKCLTYTQRIRPTQL